MPWPIVKQPEPRYCDFCGRNEHEVDVLLAGARAHICDCCAADASRVAEASKRKRASGDSRPEGRDAVGGSGSAD